VGIAGQELRLAEAIRAWLRQIARNGRNVIERWSRFTGPSLNAAGWIQLFVTYKNNGGMATSPPIGRAVF